MQNKMFRKGLVFGIIILFVGASIIPSISGNIGEVINISRRNIIENVYLLVDPPEEEWSTTFGGTDWEEGLSVQQTNDGGYIITGFTVSYSPQYSNVWLVKTNETGGVQWNKTFGGLQFEKGQSVVQTTDGGYFITGHTSSYGDDEDNIWIIKTDENGNMTWNKTFGGSQWDRGYSGKQTDDGGYILTGMTSSYGAGDHDVWLIKTDENGNMTWNKTFGGTELEDGLSVQQTADEGYIVSGHTRSFGGGNRKVWLIKTDENGNEFWFSVLRNKYAGTIPDNFFDLFDGQIITIKNMYLSEWAPKLPGRIWTIEGMKSIKKGKSRIDKIIRLNNSVYNVLDPSGKKMVLSGGYGSIRLNPKNSDENFCSYLSAVSIDNWFCDGGIPIVVSKPVYDKFQKYSRNHSAPEIEELTGVISIGWDIPWVKSIPNAIGAVVPPELAEILTLAPFLPKICIYINSPLNIKLKYSDSHPDCIAWTFFESEYIKRLPYGCTYAKFNPLETGSIEEAVDFINKYVKDYGGKRLITDFDGKEPKLNSILNLNVNPQQDKTMKEKFTNIYNEMCDRTDIHKK